MAGTLWVVGTIGSLAKMRITIACTALALLALPSVYGFQGQHPEDWTNYARVAGFPLQAANAGQIVKTAADSHVSAIASDNDIPGRYESFLDPADKLKAIRAMAEAAHADRKSTRL